jgi:MoaA/NifB/PqqE/SkfB family radical SAM enzyme
LNLKIRSHQGNYLKCSEVSMKLNNEFYQNMVLRITEECNNNCVFCSIPSEWRDKREMTLFEIKKAIATQRNKELMVEISGAEPTIHSDFFNILDYLISQNIPIIRINTNARMFSYDVFTEMFSDKVKNINLVMIKSSLHGSTAKIHDSLTRTHGSFKQAIAGFSNLIRRDINLGVNIVINQLNLFSLKEIVDLLSNLGVKRIFFSGLLPTKGIIIDTKLIVDFKELETNLHQVLEYAKNKELEIIIEKLPVCIAPEFSDNFLIESCKNQFTKFEECNGCAHNEKCMGVNKTYLDHGFSYNVHPQKIKMPFRKK